MIVASTETLVVDWTDHDELCWLLTDVVSDGADASVGPALRPSFTSVTRVLDESGALD